jgi:hypothetical protein
MYSLCQALPVPEQNFALSPTSTQEKDYLSPIADNNFTIIRGYVCNAGEVISTIEKKCFQKYHPIPWRDSISRPIAPISSMAGSDDYARPSQKMLQLYSLSRDPIPRPSAYKSS